MGTRVSVPNQVLGLRDQVSLSISDALSEWTRSRDVDNLHARTWSNVHLDAIESLIVILLAGADRPDLSRGKRVRPNRIVTLEFGRRHEPFDPLLAHRVTEMGIPEFGTPDPLLLLLDSSAAPKSQSDCPLNVIVGNLCLAIRVEEFEQAVYGAVHRRRISSAESTTQLHAFLNGGQPVFRSQLGPAVRQEVVHQAKVVCEV